MKIHQRGLLLVIFILLFLSACQAPATLAPTATQTQPAETVTPSPTTNPSPTRTRAPTLPAMTATNAAQSTATQEAVDVAAAQETIETYYHLLEEKQYTEAYLLLSDARPRPNSLKEFVASQEQFLESIELLSVQYYPESVSTLAATGAYARTPWPTYESDHCKIFITTSDVQYIGGWGAGPSGISSMFVIVVKDDESWKIAEFATGVGHDACHRYD